MDSFKIGDTVYTDADLAVLPIDRLEDLKLRVNADILAITNQLKIDDVADLARQLKIDLSRFSFIRDEDKDRIDWYISATHALSKLQRFMPYLASLIKRRIRQERTLESFFMDLARESMDKSDFNYLLEEARKRFEENARR